MPDELVAQLADVVGATHVVTDPEVKAGYTTDWTGRWHGTARAVVRPANTAEVADVVRICASAGVPIVPQGGNTGLVGGSVPHHGEVMLSLRRLDRIDELDPVGRTIAAGAGVTIARADAAAREHGLMFPVDLAARDTATLGGVVATNAGGMRVVRNGTARSQVAGIQAVLADGSVIRRWTGLTKDNVGYDLLGLLSGSEGTLGIVTKVLMRLVAPSPRVSVALLAVPSLLDAYRALGTLTARGATLEAAEFMLQRGLEMACEFGQMRQPFTTEHPAYVLTEVSRTSGEQLAEIIAATEPHIADAVIEPQPARRLWAYRELLPDAVNGSGSMPPLKLDVAVPIRHLDRFISRVDQIVRARQPAATVVVFGHLAEGNAHVNVLDVPVDDTHRLTDALLREVGELGGSISAEHGIGVAKTPWLTLSRSAADVEAMRAIKHALDPSGLLNPYAVLPPSRSPFS